MRRANFGCLCTFSWSALFILSNLVTPSTNMTTSWILKGGRDYVSGEERRVKGEG